MAAYARLKYEFTEDEKCHNLMTWLICAVCSSTSIWCIPSYAYAQYMYSPGHPNLNLVVVVFSDKRPTNNYVMETGPRFIVSSERLDERRIELATLGLQSQHTNHFII